MQRLFPVERLICYFLGLLFVANAILVFFRSAKIDWAIYGAIATIAFLVFSIGFYLRSRAKYTSWSLPMVGMGLYGLFGIAIAIFNYLLLPVGDRLIDQYLINSDAMIGFSWPEYLEMFLGYPIFSKLLGYVYMSSLVQLMAVIIFLGAMQRRKSLHVFLLTGLLASTLTVLIWYIIPSIGPSAYFEIDPVLVETIGLVVDPNYGAQANILVMNGAKFISPINDLGLVAFPSFHTGMAAMAVWFLSGYKRLFIAALVLNTFMIPAILLHGGHYLTDVLGGIVVFLFSITCAKYIADSKLLQ